MLRSVYSKSFVWERWFGSLRETQLSIVFTDPIPRSPTAIFEVLVNSILRTLESRGNFPSPLNKWTRLRPRTSDRIPILGAPYLISLSAFDIRWRTKLRMWLNYNSPTFETFDLIVPWRKGIFWGYKGQEVTLKRICEPLSGDLI